MMNRNFVLLVSTQILLVFSYFSDVGMQLCSGEFFVSLVFSMIVVAIIY